MRRHCAILAYHYLLDLRRQRAAGARFPCSQRNTMPALLHFDGACIIAAEFHYQPPYSDQTGQSGFRHDAI